MRFAHMLSQNPLLDFFFLLSSRILAINSLMNCSNNIDMSLHIYDNGFMQITVHDLKELIEEGLMLAEIGVLDQFEPNLEAINASLNETKYHGHEVKLGKPMKGDVKKYKVYVKDKKTGNVKKVNFGDPNMEIRRDNPKARKSFRARHGCGTPRASDRTKAAFWSCKMWSKKPVSKILRGK